jgi:hypothetical protein
MVAQSIREKLQSLDGEYKFNDLLTFMEDSCITFIDRRLNGPMAIATLDGVIVDVLKLSHYHDRLIFFIFIHEIAHMKRLVKNGKGWFLGQLSIDNYQEFTSELFKEEILADRYACRMFYKFNEIIYPWNQTQQLNLPEKQKAYAPMADSYFGKINNNEETYRELIQSFIQ